MNKLNKKINSLIPDNIEESHKQLYPKSRKKNINKLANKNKSEENISEVQKIQMIQINLVIPKYIFNLKMIMKTKKKL